MNDFTEIYKHDRHLEGKKVQFYYIFYGEEHTNIINGLVVYDKYFDSIRVIPEDYNQGFFPDENCKIFVKVMNE